MTLRVERRLSSLDPKIAYHYEQWDIQRTGTVIKSWK